MEQRQSLLVIVIFLALMSLACGCKENCVPNARTICKNGTVYWVDSCGNEGDKAEDCNCGCNADFSGCKIPCDCTPNCAGKECGNDGCEGTCPPGCATGETCNEAIGQCIPDDCIAGSIPLFRDVLSEDNVFGSEEVKIYCFWSSSEWGMTNYALSVKVEDPDSSKMSYNYHTLLRYGGEHCEEDTPTTIEYDDILAMVNAGAISWEGEYEGIYYDMSTMVTRSLKVEDNYSYGCWYLWIYNFDNSPIPENVGYDGLRIRYVGPMP